MEDLSQLLYVCYTLPIHATWKFDIVLKNNDRWSLYIGNNNYTIVYPFISTIEHTNNLKEQIRLLLDYSIDTGINDLYFKAILYGSSNTIFDEHTDLIHEALEDYRLETTYNLFFKKKTK